MNELKRASQALIESWLFKEKVLTIFGARQVGKTTLVKSILKKYGNEKDYFNCDIPSIAARFEQPEPLLLKRLLGGAKIVVIDEAQKIKNIGLTLKIMHDTMPEIQIIATGSSSFSLRNALSEPLTGRGLEFLLLPFSLTELAPLYRPHEIDALLSFFMRYGLYPEIVDKSETAAEKLLTNLATKYLYTDILEFERLKKSELLLQLLQLLAFQIGAEVSRNELAVKLGTSRETVTRYLDLLEKAFVIFRLKPLARNQRNEIARKEKIYFYDIGIRNSIISAFQPLELRHDIGAIFENFMIAERLKYLESNGLNRNLWFWRTHDQKEIDYIEEHNGKFRAFEFKWSKGKIKHSTEETFRSVYNESQFFLITKENYFEFLQDEVGAASIAADQNSWPL
jgi:predicted AAA+ superfamily ATPase